MRKLLACAVLSVALFAPVSTLADPVECVDAGVGGSCEDILISEEFACSVLEEPGSGLSECLLAARANYELCSGLSCN